MQDFVKEELERQKIEKEALYEIVNDTWKILKGTTGTEEFTDKDWEILLQTGRELTQKYKGKGNRYYLLFRYFFLGVQEYLVERKNGKA